MNKNMLHKIRGYISSNFKRISVVLIFVFIFGSMFSVFGAEHYGEMTGISDFEVLDLTGNGKYVNWKYHYKRYPRFN